MAQTFLQVVTRVSGDPSLAPIVQDGLARLADSAQLDVDGLTREERARLVTRFVRSLRAIRVEQAATLERQLMQMLRANPEGTHVVAIENAISVLSVRNHVGALATALSLDWSAGMKLQAAIAELVRGIMSRGAGLFESRIEPGRVHVRISCNRPLGPEALVLAPLAGLVARPSLSRVGDGSVISFLLVPDLSVAA